MATLRSDFCVSKGEGLFSHSKYCDLYIHCTAQAVAITMECSRKCFITIYLHKKLFKKNWNMTKNFN
jgi:hypothetical protein